MGPSRIKFYAYLGDFVSVELHDFQEMIEERANVELIVGESVVLGTDVHPLLPEVAKLFQAPTIFAIFVKLSNHDIWGTSAS